MPDAELSILLTGDDQIQVLNRVYRKKNQPTDVLAFAQREAAGGSSSILGDVVVSVPTARRQAERRGWDVLSEVTMLVAHGLLHLLGWDHDTAAKDRRMRRETERLCVAAGSSGDGAVARRPARDGARHRERAGRLKEGTRAASNDDSALARRARTKR